MSNKDLFTDTANTTTETPTGATQSAAEETQPPTENQADTPAGTSHQDDHDSVNGDTTDNAEPEIKLRAKTKAKADAKPGAKSKKAPAPRSPKSDAAGEKSNPSSRFADQLRTRFAMPDLALDRQLLPGNLRTALDAAGLGVREHLPTATFMALAMITAIAGPNVTCAPYAHSLRAKLGDDLGLALRICAIVERRGISFVPPAIVAAAVAVQNVLVDLHRGALDRAKEQRRIAGLRRAAHAEAVVLAAKLGHPAPPPLTENPITGPGATPRIVVDDGAASAVCKAAAGGTGILLIDERRMPSIAAVGDGDPTTACLLNRFARGLARPVTDGESGRTTMVSPPTAVWGALTEARCRDLERATSEELLGTAFVPGVPPPAGGDSRPLMELAQRVHVLTERAIELRLSPSGLTILITAAEAWAKFASARPLSEYGHQMADLARRLSVSIHIVTSAGGDGPMAAEIPAATVTRAVGLIDGVLAPMARAVLGPVSYASAVEADASALVAYLRSHTSVESPTIERREWYRACAMPVPRFNAAVALLRKLEFVVTAETKGQKGEWFAATAAVHE